jgi:coatomer subunit beta'
MKDTTDSTTKWKRLGDLALANCDLKLAERCAKNAKDLAGLLMLYTAAGDRSGVLKLADDAVTQGKFNIAFVSFFILGEIEKCFELLIETNRIPEAALLARTFLPSQISRAVALWREDLKQVSERAAAALADPVEYPNVFPDLEWALKVEEAFKQNRTKIVPASEYPTAKDDLDLDLIALVKQQCVPINLNECDKESYEDKLLPSNVVTVADQPPHDNLVKESASTPTTKSKLHLDKPALTAELEVNDKADAILNDDFSDDDDW